MNTYPLVPEDRPRPRQPDHLVRAAFVLAKAKCTNEDPASLAKRLYPGDERTATIVTRADQTIGTTTGWGADLVQTTVRFLEVINKQSAAAALLRDGLHLSVDAFNTVLIPRRTTAPITLSWVAEGDPIPAKQDVLSAVELGPSRKVACLVAMSLSLMKRSDAVDIFAELLRADVAKSLDAGVFSAEDGTGVAHKGLLNGVVATTGSGSLAGDLLLLAKAVGGGSGDVVYIAGPALAAEARLDATINAVVLPSLGVPATRLIAVDPQSIAWGTGAVPEIRTSTEALLHMSTVPLEIVDASAVIADPVRSAWQTAASVTRLILEISFVARRAGAVAFIDGITY